MSYLIFHYPIFLQQNVLIQYIDVGIRIFGHQRMFDVGCPSLGERRNVVFSRYPGYCIPTKILKILVKTLDLRLKREEQIMTVGHFRNRLRESEGNYPGGR